MRSERKAAVANSPDAEAALAKLAEARGWQRLSYTDEIVDGQIVRAWHRTPAGGADA